MESVSGYNLWSAVSWNKVLTGYIIRIQLMIRSEDVPTKNSESEAIFYRTANQSFLRKPDSDRLFSWNKILIGYTHNS